VFKLRRFDSKKFYKKGTSSKRDEKTSKGNKTFNKNETNLGPCFGCGLSLHVVKDCPILRKKVEKRRQKAKKEFKRAMMAAWSDSASSKSKDEEEQAVNPCFMANENQTHDEETEYESSDEVDYSDLLEYSKDELAQALIKCIQYEQDYLSKIKSLKKPINNLSFEKNA